MQHTRILKLLVSMAALLCLLSAVSIAAADDSWMPDRYQTLKLAPNNRIIYGLPEGMVAEHKINELGVIEYIIDTKETDWSSVIASAYQASSGNVLIHPGISMPDGAAGQRSVRYFVEPGFPENKILQNLQQDYANYGPHYNNASSSFWIARYDEATNTLIPQERTKFPVGLAAVWYDEDGNRIGSECILYTIAFTDPDAITVPLPKVLQSDITPNVPVSSDGHGTDITAQKENGRVRYEVAQPELLKRLSVTTAVAVPQIDGKDTSGWTCFVRRNGGDASACDIADAGQYGLQRRSALITSSLDNKDFSEQIAFTLEWRDENGKLQHLSQLSSIVICGKVKPWPMYAGWNPVPENRLNLTYVNPIKSGTQLTYDENSGIAYFHVDPDNLPESAAYSDAHFIMEFTPPEGATAYAFFNGNGENTFGNSKYVSQNMQNWIEQRGRTSCSSSFQLTQRLFRAHYQESRDLTVFVSDMIAGESASEYIIINWYRDIDDQEPMLTEYVFRRMDNCIRSEVSTPLASDDEIDDRITSTAIVIPNNPSANQMQFIAEMYPQDGETSRFYELRLLDQDGNLGRLPAKSKVILPYPEGTSFDDLTITFSLRHLNAKYQTYEIFSETDGTLHREKDYLWFVPSSLSPFILEWAASVDPALPAALPQTGDASHPFAALAALTAASAILYIQMKRHSR